MKEIWKFVTDYENLYEVSNYGKVKSVKRITTDKNGISYKKKEKILKPSINKYGYLQVGLSKNNKLNSFTVHSLVAKAFINNEQNKPTVNHIDGNKLNNIETNLEWATKSEQAIHSLNMNLRVVPCSWNNKFGGNHGASKKVSQYDLHNNLIQEFDSLIDAGNHINKNPSGITQVCKGRKKTCGGFIWKYS